MKRNDITQLHELSVAELNAKLTELKQQLFTAKMDNAARKLANTASLSHLKDDIARVNTIIRQKQLQG